MTKNDEFKDEGYANIDDEDNIIFSVRDQRTIISSLRASFIFSSTMSLNLRTRHYWSRVFVRSFHELQEDGELLPSNYSGDHNINFNAFNVDLIYSWFFLPGSEINLVWKNAILQSENQLIYDFRENLDHTFKLPQSNSFSFKAIYYLDYLYLKKKSS
ncbi:MAG: hypothetical protein IH946_08090 [Bacteroidetes bacterium]|nr:hypothetical protein [Bacteroidota bacterium]